MRKLIVLIACAVLAPFMLGAVVIMLGIGIAGLVKGSHEPIHLSRPRDDLRRPGHGALIVAEFGIEFWNAPAPPSLSFIVVPPITTLIGIGGLIRGKPKDEDK
jgi:hypothetical protein